MWVNSRVFHCSEAEVCNLIRRHCTLSETAYVNWRNTEKEGKVLQGHCGLFFFRNRRYLFFCLLSYTVPGSLRKKNNDRNNVSIHLLEFLSFYSEPKSCHVQSSMVGTQPSKMHSFQQSRCEIELSLTIQNGCLKSHFIVRTLKVVFEPPLWEEHFFLPETKILRFRYFKVNEWMNGKILLLFLRRKVDK